MIDTRSPTRTSWPVPTWRGAGAVAVGALAAIAGAATARVELVFLGAVLVFAVVAAWASLWLAPRPTAVRRSLSHEVAAVGETVSVETTVRTAAGYGPALADDLLPDALDPLSHDVTGGSSRRAVRIRHSFSPLRRGAHDVGPVRVEHVASFGVARRRLMGGRADPLVAVPPVVALAPIPLAGGDGSAPASRAHAGHGADNLIPRPYAPGDSMRRVHWRASAHHGDLMVREEEREQQSTAVVKLALEGFDGEAAVDRALSAGCSAVRRLVDDGATVDVVDGSGARLAVVDGEQAFLELLVLCATLEPGDSGTPVGATTDEPSAVVEVRGTGDVPPPTSPCPHVLLVADDEAAGRARARGWQAAALDDDIAGSWARARRGGSRGTA